MRKPHKNPGYSSATPQEQQEIQAIQHLTKSLHRMAVDMRYDAALLRRQMEEQQTEALQAFGPRQKFDPNQPRVPAGRTGGGQWTDTGGGSGGSSGGSSTPRPKPKPATAAPKPVRKPKPTRPLPAGMTGKP